MTVLPNVHWLTYPCGANEGLASNEIVNVTCPDCLADIDRQRQEQEAERERQRNDPNWVGVEP